MTFAVNGVIVNHLFDFGLCFSRMHTRLVDQDKIMIYVNCHRRHSRMIVNDGLMQRKSSAMHDNEVYDSRLRDIAAGEMAKFAAYASQLETLASSSFHSRIACRKNLTTPRV